MLLREGMIKSESFYYPTTESMSWSPVAYNKLICPQMATEYTPGLHTILDYVRVSRPIYHDHKTLPGFLCRKLSLITRCDTNWLMSSSVNNIIQGMKVTSSGCVEAVKDYDKGVQNLEDFKSPVCVWNKINDVATIVYKITPHNVKIDPYNNQFLDPLFAGGKTDSLISSTIHDDMIWLSRNQNKSEGCTDHEEDEGFIYISNTKLPSQPGQPVVFLHVEGHKDKTMENACLYSYCGNQGILFSDGEWMSVEFLSKQTQDQEHPFVDLKPCLGEKTVGLSSPHLNQLLNYDITMEAMYRLKCEDVLSKLINNIPISPYDISFLTQSHSGPGIVFQLRDKVLMQAQGYYSKINVLTQNLGENVIGTLSNGTKFVETRWFLSKENISHGLNGLIKVNNTLIFPHEVFRRGHIHESLLNHQELIRVSHPTVMEFSGLINRTDLEYGYQSSNPDLAQLLKETSKKISTWWNGIFTLSIFVKSTIVFGLVILACFFLSKLFKSLRSGDKRKSIPKIESMSSLRSRHIDNDSLRSLGLP